MSKVNASTWPEFTGQVVDIFEDYCGDNDIFIDNDERDAGIEDYMVEVQGLLTSIYDTDGSMPILDFAIIYGDDFDTIVDALGHYMDIDSDPSDATIKDKESAIKDTIDAFYDIIKSRGKYQYDIEDDIDDDAIEITITDDMTKYFHDKLDELFTNWEVE